MQGTKLFGGAARANWMRGVATWIAGLAVVAALGGCATINSGGSAPALSQNDSWAVLPILNYTETPQAGMAAEAITQSLLTSSGFQVKRYPANLSKETLVEPTDRASIDKALEWARKENVKYAVSGSVEEWRYKVGVDGEPAAGVTLQVIDVQSGTVVWSATGSRTGWSRSSLSAIGQKLIASLISPVTRQ